MKLLKENGSICAADVSDVIKMFDEMLLQK